MVDTWWVAAGGDSLWVVNANWDRVARVNAATAKVVASMPVPVQIPFGVVFYRAPRGWRARARSCGSIRRRTGRRGGRARPRSQPIFTQVAAGPSGL